MKSKLPTIKEFRSILKTLPRSKLIEICVLGLKYEKELEREFNEEAAHEIVGNIGLPTHVGGVSPKEARKQIKELGFSLKEMKEMFPKNIKPGLWEKEKQNESNNDEH